MKNPVGPGFAAAVDLREGEALATSATYFRGTHIYDGRTGIPVTNRVASVTVLCRSAMWADGLSTTLFVLGPDEGRAFLDKHLAELIGECKVEVLWILSDGRRLTYPSVGRHATASPCRWSPPHFPRSASFATSTLIYGIICGVGGNNMATSSITANFVMRDPKVSRAFVKALLARRPSGNVPRIRNDWEVLSDPENIREFFGHRAAKEALHA